MAPVVPESSVNAPVVPVVIENAPPAALVIEDVLSPVSEIVPEVAVKFSAPVVIVNPLEAVKVLAEVIVPVLVVEIFPGVVIFPEVNVTPVAPVIAPAPVMSSVSVFRILVKVPVTKIPFVKVPKVWVIFKPLVIAPLLFSVISKPLVKTPVVKFVIDCPVTPVVLKFVNVNDVGVNNPPAKVKAMSLPVVVKIVLPLSYAVCNVEVPPPVSSVAHAHRSVVSFHFKIWFVEHPCNIASPADNTSKPDPEEVVADSPSVAVGTFTVIAPVERDKPFPVKSVIVSVPLVREANVKAPAADTDQSFPPVISTMVPALPLPTEIESAEVPSVAISMESAPSASLPPISIIFVVASSPMPISCVIEST